MGTVRRPADADPGEQCERLVELREHGKETTEHLQRAASHFKKSLDRQSQDLGALAGEAQLLQSVMRNIDDCRMRLDKLLWHVDTRERVGAVLGAGIDANFDLYIGAVEQIVEAQGVLAPHRFQGVEAVREALRVAQGECFEKLCRAFEALAKKLPGSFDATSCQLVDGRVQGPALDLTDVMYARMRALDGVIIKIVGASDSGGVPRHRATFLHDRAAAVKETLRPLIAGARTRVTMPSMDVLAICTYRRGGHPIHLYAATLEFVLTREREICSRVFPGMDDVLKLVTAPPVGRFIKVIGKLRRAQLVSHIDVVFDLDLMAAILRLQGSLDVATADGAESEKMQAMVDQLSNFHKVYHQTMDAFIVNVRGHSPDAMPATATVSALTSNVLLYLRSLLPYSNVLAGIPGRGLAKLCEQTLQALVQNLKVKAERCGRDRVLASLFLFNNMRFIWDAVQSFGLGDYVGSMQEVDRTFQAAQEEYIRVTWRALFAKLPTPTTTLSPAARKKAFKEFTEGAFALDQSQKQMRRNSAWMAGVLSTVTQLAQRTYEPFWVSAQSAQWSKNKDKYMSLKPETLLQMIRHLYGKEG